VISVTALLVIPVTIKRFRGPPVTPVTRIAAAAAYLHQASASWRSRQTEEEMKSRIVAKTLTAAALALCAALPMVSVVADGASMEMGKVPLRCAIGGSGEVAASVRVFNQTGSTIPAGKTVSWTVLKEGTTARQNGIAVLKQNLPPEQSVYVGHTQILSDQVCTANVKR
jgi:hypothetical protein